MTKAQTASASVSLDVGGMPGVGLLSGALWHDADFDLLQGGGERALAGWTVELLRNGAVIYSVQADASGAHQLTGLAPNDVNGDQYGLRFRAPGASATASPPFPPMTRSVKGTFPCTSTLSPPPFR